MKEVQNTATKYKEKAGEALAMLSAGSKNNLDVIRKFGGCEDVVRCLTTMLDSKIKTIQFVIGGERKPTIMDIKMGCRISAAEVLKNLCPVYSVSKLEMVLRKVRHTHVHLKHISSVFLYVLLLCYFIYSLCSVFAIYFFS